jgi:hypothetical protein
MLLVSIIGLIDSQRARALTEQLLGAVRDNRAKVVVMDITGVQAVDSKVGNHLVQTVEAARATCEGCMSIDVRRWHREGRLRVGRRFSHALTWVGEPTEGIRVLAKADAFPWDACLLFQLPTEISNCMSSHNSPEIRHKEQVLAMTPGLR